MGVWIVFAGLSVATLVAVLWPLLRAARKYDDDPSQYDSAVFKDQIEEIDAELERGMISKSDAEAARAEVSRRLLAMAGTASNKDPEERVENNKNSKTLAALAVTFVLVPVLASIIYALYGSPGLPDRPLSARLKGPVDEQKIEVLLARVEERLREHPEDGRGWDVVAPVYMRLERYRDAADAYGKAVRLLGETPARLAAYGNALILSHDGIVTEPARKVLQRAVAQDGTLMKAQFWLAIAHEQDGKLSDAIAAWRKLLDKSPEGSPWRGAIQDRLATVEKQSGLTAESQPSETQAAGSGKRLNGPSHEDMVAARDMSAGDRSAMIAQMVAGLAKRLNSEGGSADEWKRLIRSYTVLGQSGKAAQALAAARTAFAGKPEILTELDEMAKTLELKKNP